MISFLGKPPVEPDTQQGQVLTTCLEDTRQEAFSMHASPALLFHLHHTKGGDTHISLLLVILLLYHTVDLKNSEICMDTYHWVAPRTHTPMPWEPLCMYQ